MKYYKHKAFEEKITSCKDPKDRPKSVLIPINEAGCYVQVWDTQKMQDMDMSFMSNLVKCSCFIHPAFVVVISVVSVNTEEYVVTGWTLLPQPRLPR